MNMWAEEFIKNEIDKIPSSVREEIKEIFLNSSREDFKPPETIELVFPYSEKEEAGFDEYCECQPKVTYSVNFEEPNIAIGGSFPTAA